MKTRSLIILAAITALALTGAGAAVVKRQDETGGPKTPATLYPGLVDRINTVATIDVIIPNFKFSIVRAEDGSWSVPEKGGYPVEFGTVKQAVVGMARLKPLAPKTARPELHAKLSLGDPREKGKGTYIGLKDKDGAEIAAIIVGKTKSVATQTRVGWHYVRRGGEDRTWLAAGRIEVWDDVTRWLDSTMPLIKRARVRAVSTIKDTGESMTVSRSKTEARDFILENIPEGRKVAYDTAPNALGSAMGFLNFDDVRLVAEGEFDKPPHIARYQTFDGLTVDARLRKHGQFWWVNFAFSFDEKARRVDELDEDEAKKMLSPEEVASEVEEHTATYSPWAYRLPKYKSDDFLTDVEKLTEAIKKDDG